MAAKVCALWVVLLSVLPFTAPFSTFDAANFINGLTTVTDIRSAAHADAAADDTAIVSDRSGIFVQSKSCALATEASPHAVPTTSISLPLMALRPSADRPSTTTVLQI